MHRTLVEKDQQISKQRSEHEATIQNMQSHIHQQVEGNDMLKNELAASQLRTQQTEHDMKLKAMTAATEAFNHLKNIELQGYAQHNAKMKTMELKFTEEANRRLQDQTEAVRRANGEHNQLLVAELT